MSHEGQDEAVVPVANKPPSLIRLLLERLEQKADRLTRQQDDSHGQASEEEDENDEIDSKVALAHYSTQGYLRRRAPLEIEAVLTTLNAGAMADIEGAFKSAPLDVQHFVETVVRAGTYEADQTAAFVGGAIDFFYEVLRSQGERAQPGQPQIAVNWPQVMNHFIECPEIAMFEGCEGGIPGTKVSSSTVKQPSVHRNGYIDRCKHSSSGIEKVYWNPYVDAVALVEGDETVSFYSPHAPGLDSPLTTLTPSLGPDFHDERNNPLYSVLAVACDEEMQDLAVLLSNRMLVMWRLRNRDKCQWQQKRELRFHAVRREVRGIEKTPKWDVRLIMIDAQTGKDLHAPKISGPETEGAMRRTLAEARLADEAAVQLDIWWNQYLKCWVTSDAAGQLSFWHLRPLDSAFLEPFVTPYKVLTEHTKLVTSHLELNKNRFTTTSLDRSIILWDHRSLSPEIKLQGSGAHSAAVLSQAYLPRFNSLVTVGCEKRVFVWMIDSTAYRGLKGKLAAHQANLVKVTAGQKLFFTLDEACSGILWDGATLTSLQTVSCTNIPPRHCLCLPEHGLICLAGRRLNFLEGNDVAAEKLGKPLTKEQQAKHLHKMKEGVNLKETASTLYCGIAQERACVLSTTEVEVRLHNRGDPGISRVLWVAPEGEHMTSFAATDNLSIAAFGTSKGSVHFVKFRSGFVLKSYPGKIEGDDWPGGASGGQPGAGGTTPAAPNAETGARETEPGEGRKNRNRFGTGGDLPKSSDQPGSDGAATSVANPTADANKHAEQIDQSTAPTQDQVARGLSSSITTVLICEVVRLVFIGTHEGLVLVFEADDDFAVSRWINIPEVATSVTALCACDEDPGLLCVGSQSGSVHVYNLPNYRYAGSIFASKWLEEPGSQNYSVKHLKLFSSSSEPELPRTLLTIDSHSRVSLWGIGIHEMSGKLKHLKLTADGGQLREVDAVPMHARPSPSQKTRGARKVAERNPAAADAGRSALNSSSGAAATGASGAVASGEKANAKGFEAEGAVALTLARARSQATVQITAITTIPGPVALPTRALNKQPPEGPSPIGAKEQLLPDAATEIAARLDPVRRRAKEEEKRAKRAQFLATLAKSHDEAQLAGLVFSSNDEGSAPEYSGTDSEGDEDLQVGKRIWKRPPSPKAAVPPSGMSLEAFQEQCRPEVKQGDGLIWIADSGGWIWCIDIIATISKAVEKGAPIPVLFDPPVPTANNHCRSPGTPSGSTTNAGSSWRQTNRARSSVRTPSGGYSSPSLLSRRHLGEEEPTRPALAHESKAQPDLFVIVGAWPAHTAPITTLTHLCNPAALVSTDLNKEVRVWSSTGDLWGHFSLRNIDGAPGLVDVWPPPHILSAQVALMRASKRVCRRIGFHTGRAQRSVVKEEGKKESAKPQGRRRRESLEEPPPVPGNSLSGSSRLKLTSDDLAGSGTLRSLSKRSSTAGVPSSPLGPFPGGPSTPSAAPTPLHSPPPAASSSQLQLPTWASPGGSKGSASATLLPSKERRIPPRVGSANSKLGTSPHGGDSGGGMSPTDGDEPNPDEIRQRRLFSQAQLGEMIRSHAFSSGCQTYKQFLRKVGSEGTLQGRPARAGRKGSELVHAKSATQLPPIPKILPKPLQTVAL